MLPIAYKILFPEACDNCVPYLSKSSSHLFISIRLFLFSNVRHLKQANILELQVIRNMINMKNKGSGEKRLPKIDET